MTRYKHHGSYEIPARYRDAVNQALYRLGYGPNNFSVPILTGPNNVTHWGCETSLTDDALAAFEAILDDVPVVRSSIHRNLEFLVGSGGRSVAMRRRAPV